MRTDPPWRTAAADSHMVDATRARDHVKMLVAGGMRQQDIADASGASMAAIGILLHGHYTPGRPPQETIRRGVERRLLAVKFAPRPEQSRVNAEPWCPSNAEFESAGYRVGRCKWCGEITWARTTNEPGNQMRLIAHPTRLAERTAA
jgi:hypothetical protein